MSSHSHIENDVHDFDDVTASTHEQVITNDIILSHASRHEPAVANENAVAEAVNNYSQLVDTLTTLTDNSVNEQEQCYVPLVLSDSNSSYYTLNTATVTVANIGETETDRYGDGGMLISYNV